MPRIGLGRELATQAYCADPFCCHATLRGNTATNADAATLFATTGDPRFRPSLAAEGCEKHTATTTAVAKSTLSRVHIDMIRILSWELHGCNARSRQTARLLMGRVRSHEGSTTYQGNEPRYHSKNLWPEKPGHTTSRGYASASTGTFRTFSVGNTQHHARVAAKITIRPRRVVIAGEPIGRPRRGWPASDDRWRRRPALR